MLQHLSTAIFLGAISFGALAQQSAGNLQSEKGWIKQSNEYTNLLLNVQFEHSPEQGSAQGVAKFDQRISDPSRADEVAGRHELEAALAKIKAARASVTDKNVQEDIDILQKSFNLQFRQEDFELAREVPFYNASAAIFRASRRTSSTPGSRR